MKSAKLFFPALLAGFSLALTLLLVAGCSKSGDASDNADATAVKSDTQTPAGVTLDAATQARIGLEITVPVATQWQPETKAYGVVLDPAELAGAVADLAAARVTAAASAKEYDRQKTLAAQN